MKTNLRGKIREFVQSEEGKVGVKSPLTLGVAVGSVLLAQAIIGTTPAHAWKCTENAHCDEDKGEFCDGPFNWDDEWQDHVGTCHN